MKTRKILDISEDHNVSLEVRGDDVTLHFTDDKELSVSLSITDLTLLRDWITNEVLHDVTSKAGPAAPVNLPDAFTGQSVPGPLVATSEVLKDQTTKTPLENRRAIRTNGTVTGGLMSIPNITRADGLEVQNLSSEIGKAREAFSPKNLNIPTKI